MRRRKALSILLSGLLLVASSCGGGAVSETPASNSFPAGDQIPEDLIIRLRRTPCYGSCPVYLLTVNAGGKVKFFGQDHTETKGQAEGRISPEQVRQLIGEFKKAKFFDLEESYTTKDCKTDFPSARTTILINGRVKKIDHNLGCEAPPELTELEKRIDEVVNSKQWIGKPAGSEAKPEMPITEDN